MTSPFIIHNQIGSSPPPPKKIQTRFAPVSHHAQPMHQYHARPSLPVNQNPNPTPPTQYGTTIHYTAALHLSQRITQENGGYYVNPGLFPWPLSSLFVVQNKLSTLDNVFMSANWLSLHLLQYTWNMFNRASFNISAKCYLFPYSNLAKKDQTFDWGCNSW